MTPHIYAAHAGEVVSIARCLAEGSSGSSLHLVVPAHAQVTVKDDASAAPTLHVVMELGTGAHVTFTFQGVVAAGKIERSVTVQCSGTGSRASAVFTCHTTGPGVFELHTIQQHTASHTQSSVTIKGVSENNSRATVSSTIYIGPGIGGVVADQVHKHLLLEQGARAVSVPALDILSDDVSCSHGSAITHLDEQQLFYLKARGYTPTEARDTIVQAFLTI